jgi:CO/xanthine dehydrogenase FAD-binding subunit
MSHHPLWNQYLTPEDLPEALSILEKYGPAARVIAGGTDLVLALSEGRVPTAEAVVDITRIPALSQIKCDEEWIEIGAGVTLSSLIRSRELAQAVPLLVEAARQIAGPQVRNLATLGGNVVNASPAADMIPPLLVLDARAQLAGPGNLQREAPLDQFVLGNRRVDLRPGEIVTAFRLAIPPRGMRHIFRKVQPRRSMAIAMLNLALLAWVEAGRIADIRLALGAVAPTAVRLKHIERSLVGLPIAGAGVGEIYAAVEADIAPISDFRASRQYRLRVARELVREQVAVILGLL